MQLLGKTDRAAAGGGRETPINNASAGILASLASVFNQFWFGPGNPLPAQAPPGTPARQFDYPVGVDTNYRPRAYEQISFDQLRMLADEYDIIRIAIETAKDQIVKRPLRFKVKLDDKATAKERESAQNDPRIAMLNKFFQRPDGEHDFPDWLRMLLEDMLVVDAASILPRFSNKGDLARFDLVDGATIFRILDYEGRTPQIPNAAYQQIIHGVPAIDITAPNPKERRIPQLVYRPRNQRVHKIYGYSPVEQIIMTINIALRREIHQLNYYTDGNVPDVIVTTPDTWTADQIKQFDIWWNQRLAGNSAERRKAKFVPGGPGMQIKETRDVKLKDDYDDFIIAVVCYSLSVSRSALTKQMNKGSAQQNESESNEEGQHPRIEWVERRLTELVSLYFGFDDIEASLAEEKDEDAEKQATILDKYLKNGSMCIDDVRDKLGLDSVPGGDVYRIYTASGAVSLDQVDNPPEPVAAASSGNEPEPLKPAKAVKKNSVSVSAGTITEAMSSAIPRLAKLLKTFFDTEKSHIVPFIVQRYEAENEQKVLIRGKRVSKASAKRILSDLNLDAWTQVNDIVSGDELLIFGDGGKQALVDLDVFGDTALFDVIDSDAIAWTKSHGAELVTRVTQTTRAKLRQLVIKAISDGLTPAELASEIENSFAFSEYRAELIARTELAFANVAGNLAGWKASGVVAGKRAILGSEHEKPDECDENEADGVIPLDQAFSSGDQACPFHPLCVCDLVAELKEDDQ